LENTISCRDSKVHELKKSFDLLTNVMVIQVNRINRILKELEEER
jgi:hypothetical protein